MMARGLSSAHRPANTPFARKSQSRWLKDHLRTHSLVVSSRRGSFARQLVEATTKPPQANFHSPRCARPASRSHVYERVHALSTPPPELPPQRPGCWRHETAPSSITVRQVRANRAKTHRKRRKEQHVSPTHTPRNPPSRISPVLRRREPRLPRQAPGFQVEPPVA